VTVVARGRPRRARAAGSRATFPRPEGRTWADRLPGRRHASPRISDRRRAFRARVL